MNSRDVLGFLGLHVDLRHAALDSFKESLFFVTCFLPVLLLVIVQV